MHYKQVKARVRRLGLVGPLLLTTASAREADPNAVIRLLAAQDAAVVTVGERLSVAARGLCPAGGWAAGLVVQTRAQYGTAYRDPATRILQLGAYPTVTFVVPAGAAAVAGLLPGDQIVTIDSAPLPKQAGREMTAHLGDSERVLAALDAGLRDGEAMLDILRGGKSSRISLRGTPACRARFEVRAGSGTNASATRDRVQVSSDLVDPARADTTLAPLIAHELSHVILGHEDALKQSRRGLLPGFGKGGRALRESEIAADRLSIYLLALAGYRPADAIAFWTDLGKRTDPGILSARTHPNWRARIAAIQIEVSRVAAQQAADQPITPPAELLAPRR